MKHTGRLTLYRDIQKPASSDCDIKIFSFSVQENELEGFVFGEVFAEDIDSGTYGEVVYSISGRGSEKYVVSD